jgi:hypothetical protein
MELCNSIWQDILLKEVFMHLDTNEKISKLSLTTLLKNGKYIFVEIDSLEPMLMDSWSITKISGDWDELIPLRSDGKFAWCFHRDSDYFTANGWEVDDLSRRVYKKLKTNK